jgi:hypothetical protein
MSARVGSAVNITTRALGPRLPFVETNRGAMAFDSQVRKRLGIEASGNQGPSHNIFTVTARAAELRHWRRQSLRNSWVEGRSQCHRSAIWRSCLARVPGAYAPGYRMPRLSRSGLNVHNRHVLMMEPIGVVGLVERGSRDKCGEG